MGSVQDGCVCSRPFIKIPDGIEDGRGQLVIEIIDMHRIRPEILQDQHKLFPGFPGIYDFKGKVWGDENLSWTILYAEENELSKPVYSRVIMVHAIDDIRDSLKHVDENIQTIGLAASLERAKEYATQATAMGAARCPSIGRMLNFEMPWDGIILIDRLIRWNTLAGPLV